MVYSTPHELEQIHLMYTLTVIIKNRGHHLPNNIYSVHIYHLNFLLLLGKAYLIPQTYDDFL